MSELIKSKVIKTELVKWSELQFIQDENFKEWIDAGDQKLVNSILKYQFIDPFKVWENDGVIYCLDGKHRYLDLITLKNQGRNVPEELPATFIDCENIKEAAELVNTQDAKVDLQRLNQLMCKEILSDILTIAKNETLMLTLLT